MIDIKKLGLPLMAIIPLLFSAGTLGASYATTKAVLAEHERAEKIHSEKIERLETAKADSDIKIAVVQNTLESITKALDRIEDRMGTKR